MKGKFIGVTGKNYAGLNLKVEWDLGILEISISLFSKNMCGAFLTIHNL